MAGLGATSAARAADHEFCEDYARSAISQYHEALRHDRCDHYIRENPGRWQDNYRAHYDWCRGRPRDQAEGERMERTHALDRCAERHHDEYHHDEYRY